MTLGDWIPDEAITTFEDDRLGHRPIVNTVADLIEDGPVPSNIAVFGPWGSGKTSFGRLLERELATRTKANIKFVRFDAWKYQETPLRRHFLSQVLGQLLDDPVQVEASRQRLYQKVHRTTYRLSKEDLRPALAVGGAVLCVIVLLAAALAMLSAWMVMKTGTAYWPVVAARLSESLPAVLLSTAVIAPLVTILMGPLTRDLEESEPSSAEQFDVAFRELADVGLKKWGRIVFFIDELDRAPADAVVSTLETIKTFLGASGCVFVVAADQIVLESALQKKPPVALTDRDNPYFTAGSGYLDKVFGYQFALPPIAQARLTPFAKALVTDRGGVWAALGADADLVVSVLVPFHVRSPRRAKVLLNNFVLAFRILQQQPELLPDRNPKSGGAELAKLVCLRTEFPVFYRAVEVFPELVPALTAALTQDTALRRYEADEELMAQVRHFLKSDASVDIMLAPAATVSDKRQGPGPDPATEDEAAADDDAEVAAEADDGDEEVEEDAEARSEDPSPAETTWPETSLPVAGKTLADHLHQYLRNTAAVSGPSRSLIYQEAQAAPTGLDPALAKTMSESAYSGDPKRAIAQLARAAPAMAAAALRYLGMLLSESVGIEKRSVLHVLLSVADVQPGSVLGSAANDLLDHVVSTDAIPLIDPKDFQAAFNVAAHAPAVRREDLERKLIARSADDTGAAVATFQTYSKISRSGQRAVQDLAGRLASLGSPRLLGTEEGVADAVTSQIWRGQPVAHLARSLASDTGEAWTFARQLITHLDEESAWALVGPNLERATPGSFERVAGLVSQGVSAPPRQATLDQLLGAMASDPSRLELYGHAAPRTAVEPSDDKLAAVLSTLIRHAPTAPADVHTGLMAIVPHIQISTMPIGLLAPVRAELEVPFSQTAEIVAARDAQHQLLITLAKEDSNREGAWLDMLSASLIAMLGTGEPIIDEGRVLFRHGIDAIWRGRPNGETLARLAEALRTDRAITDQFSPRERRFNLARIDHVMRKLALGPFPSFDSDISAALSGTYIVDYQTVAVIASAHRPDPASEPDLTLGAIEAAEADKFSREQLQGYFSTLSRASALQLLKLCLSGGIPAPRETLKVVKPRANERDWVDQLRNDLKGAGTNLDRGRILKFIAVADVQDAGNATRFRKTMIDIANGSRGAFELVVRAAAEMVHSPGFATEAKHMGKDLNRTMSRRFSVADIPPAVKRLLEALP